MTIKVVSEQSTPTANSKKSNDSKSNARKISPFSFHPHKIWIYLLAICVVFFILYQIKSLHTLSSSPSSLQIAPNSWTSIQQWQKDFINTSLPSFNDCTHELKSMATKLRQAVTFFPLKDVRYSSTAHQGHTWFMSSMYDSNEEGEVQYQQFPSNASKGRLLCFKGNDTHDGSWNSYALAWPQTLPYNATLMKGLTFISYNHYDYANIWHGLSAMVPFVAWHIKNDCAQSPSRWILYHWGELRTYMAPWLRTVMEATFGVPLYIEGSEELGGGGGGGGGDASGDYIPACFEESVVMRHNEGGMSRQKRMEVYDLMRCKTRMYCNVSLEGRLADVNGKGLPVIGLTLLMRTGPRSFKNESIVIDIFNKECKKVEGCRLMVAYSSNLTFCEQVKLMSLTDILVSPHGAQLSNLFLMDRDSSIMEFFPKGWLEFAGVGQNVFQWLSSWSGMNHDGTWRDPVGEPCPYPENDRRCMSVYKNGKVGYNETYFSQWSRNVLNQARIRKIEKVSNNTKTVDNFNACSCS